MKKNAQKFAHVRFFLYFCGVFYGRANYALLFGVPETFAIFQETSPNSTNECPPDTTVSAGDWGYFRVCIHVHARYIRTLTY